MSEHTKGRLEAFTEESFSGWYALRDQGHFEVGSGDGGFDEADARRLAACWNAFDRMDTDIIELLGSVSDIIRSSNEQLVRNAKEIVAARALLCEALETFDDNPDEDHEIADRIRNYLDACDTLGDGNG